MIRIYFGLLGADGNWFSHMNALEGEDLYLSYKKLQQYTDLPVWLKAPVSSFLEIVGEHRKAHAVRAVKSGGFSVREYWDLIADLNEYCRGVTEEFAELNLDAIILPTTGLVATPHGMVRSCCCMCMCLCLFFGSLW